MAGVCIYVAEMHGFLDLQREALLEVTSPGWSLLIFWGWPLQRVTFMFIAGKRIFFAMFEPGSETYVVQGLCPPAKRYCRSRSLSPWVPIGLICLHEVFLFSLAAWIFNALRGDICEDANVLGKAGPKLRIVGVGFVWCSGWNLSDAQIACRGKF